LIDVEDKTCPCCSGAPYCPRDKRSWVRTGIALLLATKLALQVLRRRAVARGRNAGVIECREA
jgi:hypothetical protein